MQEKPPREGEPIDPRDDDKPTKPPPSDALGVLLSAAQMRPEDEETWDRLEELAAKNQSPDEVALLLREALKRDLPKETTIALARRAVRFHDEWFSEPGPLIDVLSRVVELAPEEA